MTSYAKLIQTIKTQQLHEAHQVFSDIMQQKVAQKLAEVRQHDLLKEGYQPGTRVKIKPTASGLKRSYPAANWITQTTTIVTLKDYAPNSQTLDVLDVTLADGREESIYDFNIIGRA
jgi:hypothetical protein